MSNFDSIEAFGGGTPLCSCTARCCSVVQPDAALADGCKRQQPVWSERPNQRSHDGQLVASKSLNFGTLPSSYTPLDMDPLPWTNPQGAGGHSMSVLSEAEGLFGVAEHNSGTNKELMGRTATSMLGVSRSRFKSQTCEGISERRGTSPRRRMKSSSSTNALAGRSRSGHRVSRDGAADRATNRPSAVR